MAAPIASRRLAASRIQGRCLYAQALLLCSLFALGLIACSGDADPGRVRSNDTSSPNILLIVVDDMGFADLGSFGGEIPTPHLDALAYDGVRLTNFIATPACSPTRAALLTGVDHHRTGFGNLAEELSPNQRDEPGYEGYLNERVVTIATLLRDAGYRTYMTGKWHLGTEDHASPLARGFQRSFAMLKNASHFADMLPAYHPDPNARAGYREDADMLDVLPDDFEYSSQFYVDRLIDYIDGDGDSDAPFFAYLAFSAPHWPLQAPDEAIERFRGRYDEGYDKALDRRLARQRELGVIPENAVAAERFPKGVDWASLTEDEQRVESRAMEIYAAMIAEVDRHTGRLVDHLREQGVLEDTVILFLSDNGAEGHDIDDTWPMEAFPEIRKVIDERYDFSFDNMGRPGSYTYYGPNWARVSAPSLRLFKAFTTEGGVRTAAFAHFPRRFATGAISDELVVVKDLAPTILELAGVAHPGADYRDRNIEPMSGISALDVFEGRSRDGQARVHVDELIGKRAVRAGDWKIVSVPPPYGTGDWQLYNLADDLAEMNDLAAERPDKLEELERLWADYAEQNGVIMPDWLSGY